MMDAQSNMKAVDSGTTSKKKKDSNNRKAAGAELPFKWDQQKLWIIITARISNNDYKNAKLDVKPNFVSLTLPDGRSFSTKLFERIVPDGNEVSYKSGLYTLKLLKLDPEITWPSLDPQTSNSTDSVQCDNNNVNQNNNYNNNLRNSKKTNSKNKSSDDSKETDKVYVTPTSIKLNYSERTEEKLFMIYIFVKGIKEKSLDVHFKQNSVSIIFSTGDAKFLEQNSPDGSPPFTDDTLFKHDINLMGDVIVENCTCTLTASKLELKLKKASSISWNAISPVTDVSPGIKKSFENADTRHVIPPPPPAPPTPVQSRKPTCLVSPSSHVARSSGSSANFSTYSNSSAAGYMGLDNIGNTCFMNSVLQTLINTRELKEYFCTNGQLNRDLNKDNPLGQGGRLAVAFSILMKTAWAGTLRSFSPSKLKSVMSMKANQFSGFAQHDAQEFMVELLDGLHEDLNRIKKKPYFPEPPNLDGWKDVDAANEAWRIHKLRNDSAIDDLFKGQFRSALTCHECGKISVKFDEFCCFSVPIPKDQRVLNILFFYKGSVKGPAKIQVSVNADATVVNVKRELQTHVGIHPSNIVIIESCKHRIQRILQPDVPVHSISLNDNLLAFEVVNPEQLGGQEVIHIFTVQRLAAPTRPIECAYCGRKCSEDCRIQRCTKCLAVGYCSSECQKGHWSQHSNHCRLIHEFVGAPFVVSMAKSHATYANIARAMEDYARHSVDIFQPPVSNRKVGDVKRQGSTSSTDASPDEEEMDVDMEKSTSDNDELAVDTEITETENKNTSSEWGTGHRLGGEVSKKGAAGSSVCAVPPLLPHTSAATKLFNIIRVTTRGQTLADATYFKDEGNEPLYLEEEDVIFVAMDWRTDGQRKITCLIKNKDIECDEDIRVTSSASFRGRQQTTLEACMDLFTQPENLSEGDSWRCPRCKKPVEATKQMSLWRLPPVLIVQLKRFSFKYVLYSDKIDKFVNYPIRELDIKPYIAAEGGDGGSTLYDLYGVVNHMGRLLGGHYTAYARYLSEGSTNTDIDWRVFDDSRVYDISEERVVNDQAYLLLYRRRDTPCTLTTREPSPERQVDSNILEEVCSNSSSCGSSSGSPAAAVPPLHSTVMHVPAATPAVGGAVVEYNADSAAPSYEVSMEASPEAPLNNMHIAPLQENQQNRYIVSRFGSPVADSSYKATSTINTNNAACGNLVSNISIEAGQTNIVRPTGFATSPGSAVFLPSNIEPDSSDIGDGIDSTGAEMGDVTPMSVSSASQPSLSSTEDDYIGTAQEELD